MITNVVFVATNLLLRTFACNFLPTSTQEIVFELDSQEAGYGNIQWMRPGETKPAPGATRYFDTTAPGHPITYRVSPQWKGSAPISRLLFNPKPCKLLQFRVEDIHLEESIAPGSVSNVHFRLTNTDPGRGRFRIRAPGLSKPWDMHFHMPPDGLEHEYSLALPQGFCSNRIVWYDFCDAEERPLPVKDVSFSKDPIPVPPALALMSARPGDAIPRAGRPTPIEVVVMNTGTAPLEGVRFAVGPGKGETLEPGDITLLETTFPNLAPGPHTLNLYVTAKGVQPLPVSVSVNLLPSLNLPKADYVPPPQTVESDYELGAFYFPGWFPEYRARTAWKAIWQTDPQRKPVLGWYDESNPEVMDWQIKHLAENGIKFIFVDSSWNAKTTPSNSDNFIAAIKKARYKSNLKWAQFLCNHGEEFKQTPEAFLKTMRNWTEAHFKTPEYYRIDDKPVVMIINPDSLAKDFGGDEACKQIFNQAREEAQKAGLKGIEFIAMKWNERDTAPWAVQKLVARGYDMTSIYHFIEPAPTSESIKKFPYSDCVKANAQMWLDRYKTGILPFLPSISTGWDDRPWTEIKRITDKNVPDFRRLCIAAKRFADKTGIKRLMLSPLNEWGEGSYCQPNAEFGFGFFEAIREVFCKKPVSGWPLNYTPADIGLGPYGWKVKEEK